MWLGFKKIWRSGLYDHTQKNDEMVQRASSINFIIGLITLQTLKI